MSATKKGRPQSPKLFEMCVPISTLVADVGAYTIEHSPTGKQYHGSTKNLYRRVIEHQNDLRSGKHSNNKLQELYDSGEGSFKLNFIPTTSPSEALVTEQNLIDTTNPDVLLNLSLDTSNDSTGMWKNPEVRERLTKARIGNKNALGTIHTEEFKQEATVRMLGNKHLVGHVHSVETRKKMSESALGKKRSQQEIDLAAEGRTKHRAVVDGVEYKNVAAAAVALGLSGGGVKKRCLSDKHPNYTLVPK